ncbi:MAG: hypothetical protein U1E56_05200 [Bauldia sp.]
MIRLAGILPLLLLAGCYTSDRELVSATEAVAPYKKIVYQSVESDKPTTLVARGSSYAAEPVEPGRQPFEFRFKPLGGSLYLAQLKGVEGKRTQYLFGVVRLDAGAKTAQSFAASASKADQGPDLKPCTKTGADICLTRIEPYVIHALAGIANGDKPFDSYKILTLE